MSLLAGIGPGLTLEADPPPAGLATGADQPVDGRPAVVGIDEVGRMLRCGEATVRRLIRTAVLRPVGDGERPGVRRDDVEAYLRSAIPRRARKPGE